MIFAKEKKFLGGPERVLLDDKRENLNEFKKAGGIEIMVPDLGTTRIRSVMRSGSSIINLM